LRLATRIAIMKDGVVVQIGTPEELVLKPADSYVARFTDKVVLADVVRVGSVMSPALLDDPSEALDASMLVREAARRVFERGRAMPVSGADGRIVGSIGPQIIGPLLLARPAS
jgi:glycine betaine/proline transport system ATP-binding protein